MITLNRNRRSILAAISSVPALLGSCLVTVVVVVVVSQTYSRQLAEVQEDLRVTRQERERLEQNNERLRKDLQMAQNTDVAYGQVRREGGSGNTFFEWV